MSSILDAIRKKEESEDARKSPFRGAPEIPRAPRTSFEIPIWMRYSAILALIILTSSAAFWFGYFRVIGQTVNPTPPITPPTREKILDEVREMVRQEMQAQPTPTATTQPAQMASAQVPTLTFTPASTLMPVTEEPPTPKPKTLPVARSTRPPKPTAIPQENTEDGAPPPQETKPATGIEVQGIIWSERAPMAIVNGNLVEAGAVVDGKKIVRIEKEGIILEGSPNVVRTKH